MHRLPRLWEYLIHRLGQNEAALCGAMPELSGAVYSWGEEWREIGYDLAALHHNDEEALCVCPNGKPLVIMEPL